MAPAPYLHFGDTEDSGSSGIAAKHDLEDAIMPATGDPALETR
jgi:hypothetical protein